MKRFWQRLFPVGEADTESDRGAVVVLVEPERPYYWCACGKTGSAPFCDQSGAASWCSPQEVRVQKPEYLYFCGCARTATPPFCDGRSHRR